MSHGVQTEKPNISSSAALWSVLIFVGLIIAAINFVRSENSSEGHGGGHGAATEQHGGGAHHGTAEGHEAASAEHGTEHSTTPAATPPHDSAAPQGHEAPAAGHTTEEAHH